MVKNLGNLGFEQPLSQVKDADKLAAIARSSAEIVGTIALSGVLTRFVGDLYEKTMEIQRKEIREKLDALINSFYDKLKVIFAAE